GDGADARSRGKHQEKNMLTKRTIIFISLASLIITTTLFKNPLAWPRASASRKQDSAPQEQANASIESLPGLQKRVTVVRDRVGVPHVTASSDHDVYFMMGYLHAHDRFFQMDTLRRTGSGTLAELLGAGPNDRVLSDDTFNRLLGIGRSAERS